MHQAWRDGQLGAAAGRSLVGSASSSGATLTTSAGHGGWSLPSLGTYRRRDKTDNDPNAPSDGYATGLVVLVLRQAGVSADDPAIKKGVAWLKTNQREVLFR